MSCKHCENTIESFTDGNQTIAKVVVKNGGHYHFSRTKPIELEWGDDEMITQEYVKLERIEINLDDIEIPEL